MMIGRSRPRRRFRSIGWLLMLVAASLTLSACGGQAPKTYRIGVLAGLEFFAPITDGLKTGMAELGYVEGKNVAYDVQTTNIDTDAYKRILQGFVADKVDLIVVYPTEATQVAKVVTADSAIPVVFVYVVTEGTGLVNSVREPGGNMTGVRLPSVDMALARFDVLRTIAPGAKRVLLPYQAGYPIVPDQLTALHRAADAAGMTLVEASASSVAELQADLQRRGAAGDAGADAILMLVEPLVLTPGAFSALGAFAAEHKLVLGGIPMSADGYDSAFGVYVDPFKTGRQAAPLADKILDGIPAGTIPVVSAESFLQINYRQTQSLGLTVPEGLLSQAADIVR